MLARTKQQKLALKYAKELMRTGISRKKMKWAENNIVCNYGYLNKAGTLSCLMCNHKEKVPITITKETKWQDEVVYDKEHKCKGCSKTLQVKLTNDRIYSEESYAVHFSVINGVQVIRNWYVTTQYRTNKLPNYRHKEVSMIFIFPNTKSYEIVGYLAGNSYYQSNWYGYFELRNRNSLSRHTISPEAYYPLWKIIPELKRNGFKNELYGFSPQFVFTNLLKSSYFETLWKLNKTKMIQYFSRSLNINNKLQENWHIIKGGLKRNYFNVKSDLIQYFDYLEMLKQFGYDLHSPKYLYPKDIVEEHQVLLNRLRKIEEANRRSRELAEQIRVQKEYKIDCIAYKKRLKKYEHLIFVNKELVIKPITTLPQLKKESKKLIHCAFISGYHKQKQSLLLSAYVNNVVTETVEVNLRDFDVVQSRGYDNEPTKHKKAIIALVKKNMEAIYKAHHSKNKKVKSLISV